MYRKKCYCFLDIEFNEKIHNKQIIMIGYLILDFLPKSKAININSIKRLLHFKYKPHIYVNSRYCHFYQQQYWLI
jgi:hypothetical protein